ncbi:hypothetical protein GCM10008961_31850 [Deinococcus knuensis]|uniref:Uncharacterized protein n=1 Tax=Deinococcus knuensis TaxID=1837380 RepID=A0ABQ2SRD2_9DEIO|nr:hypothetical protein GCM10008961_31850 [Deinococcus knuensis]
MPANVIALAKAHFKKSIAPLGTPTSSLKPPACKSVNDTNIKPTAPLMTNITTRPQITAPLEINTQPK